MTFHRTNFLNPQSFDYNVNQVLNYATGTTFPLTITGSPTLSVSSANGLTQWASINTSSFQSYSNASGLALQSITAGTATKVGLADAFGNYNGSGTLTVNTNGSYSFTPIQVNGSQSNAVIYFNYLSSGMKAMAQIHVVIQLDPIVLSLDGSPIHLISADQSGVMINNADGTSNQLGWITSSEGILMLNSNHDGSLTNTSQITFSSGFNDISSLANLQPYDTNHNGQLDAGDANFLEFGLMLANGKFESLSTLGIVSISLVDNPALASAYASSQTTYYDEEGNLHTVYDSNGNYVKHFITYQDTAGNIFNGADVNFSIGMQTNSNATSISEGGGLLSFSDTLYNTAHVAPIVLDLSGSGIHLISAEDSLVSVYLDVNGSQANIGWIADGAGILAYDPNHTGQVTNINQIDFRQYVSGAQTDLQGLVVFDTNYDGKLDANDAAFHDFGVLLANGTFESLQQAGVTSIGLASDNQTQMQNGNVINGMTTYQTSNGSVLSAADVSFGLSVQENSDPLSTKDVISTIGQLDLSHLGSSAPSSKQLDIAALFGIHSANAQSTEATLSSYAHDASPIDSEHIDHVLKEQHNSSQ